MTAERSAALDIVDAIMREREGGQLRTRREWERFVEDAIGGVVLVELKEAGVGDIDWWRRRQKCRGVRSWRG